MTFFTPEQQRSLDAKLPASAVKQRKQSTRSVSYIEGYAAIESANRIFGYGNWQGRIVSLTQAEFTEFKREGKDGIRIAYLCEYEVMVWNADRSQCVQFTDIGYGSGTSYNGAGEAVESATKEAVTDAMKRTLRNFGNQFGLALYDKEQKNVARPLPRTPRRSQMIEKILSFGYEGDAELDTLEDDELIALGKSLAPKPVEVAA